MLHHPTVLTASKWQDWLHPRGKDGRFIEKDSFVNVFADPNAPLNDRTAVRRRARVTTFTPDGAVVQYQDLDGNPVEPDAAAGFPDVIPVQALAKKVSTAPQAIAHLDPRQSAEGEVQNSLKPAMTAEEYADEIAGLNQGIRAQFPEQAGVVSTGQDPISDADYQAHVKFIKQVNEMANGHGLTLDAAFKDSYGMWSEEMHLTFEAVVDEAYAELTENQTKPRDYRALMLGGLPGAGKSSTLKVMREQGMFRDGEWVTVNPDHFKEKILEKGLGPQIEGLTPAETSNFIHEVSSEMNHMLEQLLTAEGYNIIFDITMGGQFTEGEQSWTEKLINGLETADYVVDGMFVSVTPDIALSRADRRHRQGLDALRTGVVPARGDENEVKYGGRVVPDAVLAKARFPRGDPQGEQYASVNDRNFDKIKDQFGRWAVWDNSEDSPTFLAGSGSGPDDPDNMPGYYPPSSASPEVAA